MLRTTCLLVASCALTASAQPAVPAGWPAVVDGYRRALEKGGITGSSLMIVRDGRIIARQTKDSRTWSAGSR